VLGIAGCKTPGEPTAASDEAAADAGKPAGETSLLLSMTYAEAAAISPKKLEVPPFFKVAADEIEVVRMNKDGSPRNVRAKGKVFLQMDFREPGIALCQEAYFGDDEVILRGRPILKRGGSVVEGMASSTVFYILGLRLRVIGQHRLLGRRTKSTAAAALAFLRPSGRAPRHAKSCGGRGGASAIANRTRAAIERRCSCGKTGSAGGSS
jgi:hypothetical protein